MEADVLIWSTYGPPCWLSMSESEGIGGSELELVQVAHALADRGHNVVLANGVTDHFTESGVRYMPHGMAAGMRVRALYVQRCSPVPQGIVADKTVIRPTDVPAPIYDVHNAILGRGEAELVCVSKWQARLFAFAKRKRVINPILGDTPKTERVAGRFIFASGAGKGWRHTKIYWHEFVRRLQAAGTSRAAPHLLVTVPGQSGEIPDITDADEAAGIRWGGIHPSPGYRSLIASAEGLFYAGNFQETFGCCAALAERSRSRTHVLALRGLGGLPEATVNRSLITTDPEVFLNGMVEAYNSPDDPRWYADPALVADRSPMALAPEWEKALGLVHE